MSLIPDADGDCISLGVPLGRFFNCRGMNDELIAIRLRNLCLIELCLLEESVYVFYDRWEAVTQTEALSRNKWEKERKKEMIKEIFYQLN